MLGMATFYCKLIVNFSYWYRIFIIKPVSKHLSQQKIIKAPLWATWYNFPDKNRSSLSEVFCKKGVPRNFSKFTGKHLWQGLSFNKLAGRPATLLKKIPWHRRFPVNFEKFLKTAFPTVNLQWLLLQKETQWGVTTVKLSFLIFII